MASTNIEVTAASSPASCTTIPSPRGDEFSASANVAALLGKKASLTTTKEKASSETAAVGKTVVLLRPDEQHSMSSLEAIQPGSSTSNGLAKTPTTTTAVIKGTTPTKTIKTRRSSTPSVASKEPLAAATAIVTTNKIRKTSAPNPQRGGRTSTSGWRPRRTSSSEVSRQRPPAALPVDQEVAKVASASAAEEDEDCGRLI